MATKTSEHKTRRGGVTLGQQGRIVIPVEARRVLKLKPGQKLAAYVEDGRLIIETREQLLHRIQEKFAEARKRTGVSALDELFAERRAAAKKELEQ